MAVPGEAHIEWKEKEKLLDLKRGSSCSVMACKCYWNTHSGLGFGSLQQIAVSVRTEVFFIWKEISTESNITWNHNNFMKTYWSLRLQVVACPQLNNDQWTSKLTNLNNNRN